MSWTYHELLGLAYPVFFCEMCQKSFIHPKEYALDCPVCQSGIWGTGEEPVCDHSRSREITSISGSSASSQKNL